jgi:anti-sigma28 factor (negative regulator of flagellin synthesis)
MDINHIRPDPSKNTDINKLKSSAEKPAPNSINEETRASASNADQLIISEQARDLQHTDQALKTALKDLPDIRPEKVQSAKLKATEGFYSQDDTLSQVADSLLNEKLPSSTDAYSSLTLKQAPKSAEVRDEKVALSRTRKESNFYDQNEPLLKTAENLLKPPIERI